MHRHGYQGRKLGRERDQRRSLIKSLADSLIIHESIETTLAKAKEVSPYVEKLITKSKKSDLASRRHIIKHLQTVAAANKLVDEIAPKLTSRNSGHLRVTRTRIRKGDNVQLASVSFVDDLSVTAKKEVVAEKLTIAKKPAVKKTARPKAEAKK